MANDAVWAGDVRVLAMDVYDTMISPWTGRVLPMRRGLLEFLERARERGIVICTCSDTETEKVTMDLERSRVPLDYFDEFFRMEPDQPKDFKRIAEHYRVKPGEIFVVGDSWRKDINPAEALGCRTFYVPVYVRENDMFNMARVIV